MDDNQKFLDQKWHDLLKQLGKSIESSHVTFQPGIIVDFDNKILSLDSYNEYEKAPNASLVINDLKDIIEKNQTLIAEIKKQINEEEANKLVRDYYLTEINSIELNNIMFKVQHDTKLSESEKNKVITDIYNETYPIYSDEFHSQIINEFLDFIEYVTNISQYKGTNFLELEYLLDANLYRVKRVKTNIDYSKITEAYFEFEESHRDLKNIIFTPDQVVEILNRFLVKMDFDKHSSVKLFDQQIFSVDESRTVHIPKNAKVTKKRLIQLMSHEVMVHVHRGIRGLLNINNAGYHLKLLKKGTANDTPYEEGLGSFYEQNIFYDSDKHDVYNLFNFYLRIITIQLALNYTPYEAREILTKLCDLYAQLVFQDKHFSDKTRDILLMRVYKGFKYPERGCVNGRIGQYLYGNQKIWDFYKSEGSVNNLYAGKIMIEQIEDLKTLGFEIPENICGTKEYPREYLMSIIDECF
jgi:hypothetical protein